jgi:hypothetical protein
MQKLKNHLDEDIPNGTIVPFMRLNHAAIVLKLGRVPPPLSGEWESSESKVLENSLSTVDANLHSLR